MILTEEAALSMDQVVAEASATWEAFMYVFKTSILPYALKILVALIIWIIGNWVIKRLVKLCAGWLDRTKLEKTVSTFMQSIIRIILYVLLAFVILQVLGIATASIIAVLGSVGLTVGLALQGSLSNFAGGVLILVLKPFKVGDFISAAGNDGTVQAIDIFYTKLTTPDNRDIVIPNGTLSNSNIVNVSGEKKRRIDLVASASYSDDIDKVKEVLRGIAENSDLVLKEEGVTVFLSEYAASSVDYTLRFWVAAENYWAATFEVRELIKKKFDENGIEIPFKQVDINIKNADALK